MTATQSLGRVNRLAAASTGAAPRRVSALAAAAAVTFLATLLFSPLAVAGRSNTRTTAAAGADARSLRSPHAVVPLELQTLARINVIRERHGLRPLSPDEALSSAATAHSRQMLTDGYFSHSTAVGVGFARRIGYYYPARGATVYGVGENILYTEGSVNATRIVSLWMRSPGHRENLLSPSWRELGVAVVAVGSSHGVFQGGPATVVTVDFGVRT